MIMQPAVIALFIGSVLVSFMILYSVKYGFTILMHWNLESGSELQLELEKKTYLISTILAYTFAFQLFSLFLFIFTADKLHTLFTGAMCAAGTLNVNSYGYPALLLKIINFVLGGTWLVINHADNKAFDYPLIRKKYLLLIVIAPLVVAEAVIQGAYFLSMKPHVITSCCGSLFSLESYSILVGMVVLPSVPMRIIFYLTVGLTLISGFYFYFKGESKRIGYSFAVLSVIACVVSAASLISFISPYFYELPTHRCPFCILQKEYHYTGYSLYITLLTSAVCGTGIGSLIPFRAIKSLKQIIARILKKLTIMVMAAILLFAVIATYAMIFTDFKLEGY